MTGLLQVVTATETKEQGISLAGEAVRQRLAASGQVHGPVTSAFWHLGEFAAALHRADIDAEVGAIRAAMDADQGRFMEAMLAALRRGDPHQ